MKNKDVDKLINDSLNSDLPSRSVLDKAKSYMALEAESSKQNKEHKKHFNYKWAIALTAIFLLVLIASMYVFRDMKAEHFDRNYMYSSSLKIEEYTSINDYGIENEKTFLSFDFNSSSCYLFKTKENNEIVYIQENYVLDNNEKVESISLNIIDPAFKGYIIEGFEIYNIIQRTYFIAKANVNITYDYKDNDVFHYYVSFVFNDYKYCISIDTNSEERFYEIINALILE